MKSIRSYTSIWSVEKVIYAINDVQLPFPVSFTQMAWFVISFLAVMMLGGVFPLSLIDAPLVKYVAIPVGLTWFMSQKSFDGKRPYGWLKSILLFWMRPKVTYAGKAVKLKTKRLDERVTIVRSEYCVLSD